jgi:hypothetical protein
MKNKPMDENETMSFKEEINFSCCREHATKRYSPKMWATYVTYRHLARQLTETRSKI